MMMAMGIIIITMEVGLGLDIITIIEMEAIMEIMNMERSISRQRWNEADVLEMDMKMVIVMEIELLVVLLGE